MVRKAHTHKALQADNGNNMWFTQPSNTKKEGLRIYDELKSLWWVLQFVGLFPVQTPSTGPAKFSWFSLKMAYSLFCFVTMTIVLFFELRLRIDLVSRVHRSFDSLLFSISLSTYSLPHFWLPFCAWLKAHDFAKLLNNWDNFQRQFRHVTGRHLSFCVRRQVRFLVILTVSVSNLYVICEFFALGSLAKYWEIFVMSYSLLLVTMHLLVWCSLCYVSSKTAVLMMRCLKQDFQRRNGPPSQLVNQYRSLWLNLSRLTRDIGNILCYQFSHIILLMFFLNILNTYQVCSLVAKHGVNWRRMWFVAHVITFTIYLIIFCSIAESTTSQVGRVFKHDLQDLSTKDGETLIELHHFEDTIHMNPPVISLGGFVNVNMNLLVSLFATTVTYLVVILQFKLSDHNDTNIDMENLKP